MGSDYIPGDHLGKQAYFSNFAAWLSTNGPTFTLAPAVVTAYGTDVSNLGGDNATVQSKELDFRSAVANRDANEATLEDTTRALVRQCNNHPAMTDALRASAGIPLRDTTPSSPVGGGIGPSTPEPVLIVDFSKRRKVTVIAGTNPGNKRLNKKPPEAKQIVIERSTGGLPPTAGSWVFLAQVNTTPYLDNVNNDAPIVLYYRCCYVDSVGTRGPFCDGQLATPTP